MRTAHTARGRGVATALIAAIVAEAKARGYRRAARRETGTEQYFQAARRLYERAGSSSAGRSAATARIRTAALLRAGAAARAGNGRARRTVLDCRNLREGASKTPQCDSGPSPSWG